MMPAFKQYIHQLGTLERHGCCSVLNLLSQIFHELEEESEISEGQSYSNAINQSAVDSLNEQMKQSFLSYC